MGKLIYIHNLPRHLLRSRTGLLRVYLILFCEACHGRSLVSFPNVAFGPVPMLGWLTMALGPVSSFQGMLSTAAPLLSSPEATDGVVPLALCPQVLSLKHTTSSEAQAAWGDCLPPVYLLHRQFPSRCHQPVQDSRSTGIFSRQSICTVISLDTGMSRTVNPTRVFARQSVRLVISLDSNMTGQ